MKNPFAPQQVPDPYFDLQKRILQKVQDAQVNDQIFEVVQKAYEDTLKTENIVLLRQDRKRLLAQILKSVLGDMIKKLDPPSAKNG
jgi:uncharacterized membrane protein YheB (UPF0754 family)